MTILHYLIPIFHPHRKTQVDNKNPAENHLDVNFGETASLFGPAVDALDPVIIIEEARTQAEERKQRYLERSST